MDKLIAYCGLDCAKCPAYVATQSGDPAELERVAAEWREAFNMPDLTVESLICDGCLPGQASGRLSSSAVSAGHGPATSRTPMRHVVHLLLCQTTWLATLCSWRRTSVCCSS